jgi:tRNA 2-thiouridine synthesizing protein C
MNTTNSNTNITLLARSAPYGSDAAKLCLDISIAAAVFEQTVTYIFLDDGVYQVLNNQDSSAINSKTLGKGLEALSLYGIEKLYADEDSLRERNLSLNQLLPQVELVSAEAIKIFISQSKSVMTL